MPVWREVLPTWCAGGQAKRVEWKTDHSVRNYVIVVGKTYF